MIKTSRDHIALNNLKKHKSDRKINLKINPDLYKIRIGKKKTGLPNYDYPLIYSSNKIKNSKFTVFSIEYDENHLENNESYTKNNSKTNKSINHFLNNKTNNLNEKLINKINNDCGDMEYSSAIDVDRKLKFSKKKCCERCLIF